MKNFLRSAQDYELFIYTLTEQFPSIRRFTLQFIRVGSTMARVNGILYFDKDTRLVVRERVLYDRMPAVIDEYGYEVWQGENKLYWYDAQPHPNDPSLESTFPYHEHIPPDIKHNRVPAPGMQFTSANLPILIHEIETLLAPTTAQQPE